MASDPYLAARTLLDAYPLLLDAAASQGHAAHRPLPACELRVHSQNGEDGVIAEMLARIGPGTRSFVEFGAQAGSEGNCVFLADWCGWRGLFMEPEADAFARLQRKYALNPAVQTLRAMVTPATIDTLLHRAGMPYDLDILSIDVDGADYWIWSAITRVAPRIVVIEYNAALGGERRLVQHPDHTAWNGSAAFGASIAALVALGQSRGYALVHTELVGVNAFFVREDHAALFPEIHHPRMRGVNHALRSQGHPPSKSKIAFVEVPEPPGGGNAARHAGEAGGVQRVVARVLGSLVLPATDRVLAPTIRDTGVWDQRELDWLTKHVPRGGTCLNVGANIGYFTCWMSRLVGPRGRVVAVEANPELLPFLRENLAACALANVDVESCAAGAAPGTARLWLNDTNSGDNRVFDPRRVDGEGGHRAHGFSDAIRSVDVPMQTGDAIVGERWVDVIFVDAQGWDHHVLSGLRATIDRCRPVILFEFVPGWIRDLGEDPAAVLAACAAWGYRLGSPDLAESPPLTPEAILAAMAAAGQAFVNIELLPVELPPSGGGRP